MDDEKFKLEVLNRLDKIVALLSLSCNLSKAALERMHQEGVKPEAPKPQPAGAAQDGTPVPPRHYQIRDEMQESYDLAVQRWKAGRGA